MLGALSPAASAWGVSEDAAIVKLIDHWKGTTSAPAVDNGDEVRIHALYSGKRADGIYRRSIKCIDIISGPGAGCVGLKPSPATAEVIKAVNPRVSPSRNGWSFWIIKVSMTRAVVLSGGGRAGAAWMLGLAVGLREAGVDLAAADLIVGTSAGARTGAQLTTGAVDQALTAYRPHRLPVARTYATLLDFVAAARPIQVSAGNQVDAARQIARLGPLGPGLPSAAERRQEIAASLPVHTWPGTPLKISAVDADSGHRVVFDARSGVSLTDAVTASGALPGVYPLAEVNGRRYADGGAWSLYSADLAAGYDIVIVISPMPLNPSLRGRLDAEMTALGDCVTHLILADEVSLTAIFSPDPNAVTAQDPSLGAGMAQATRELNQLQSAWNAHVAQR